MNTEPHPPVRFVVDHMLVKLGKYLRILGYDAAWDPAVRTHELIQRANVEGRIFLTRNGRLPEQYPRPDRVMTIRQQPQPPGPGKPGSAPREGS